MIVIISSCQNKSEIDEFKNLRIISLAPHITEIVYALGAQNQLIAVTDFCNYPPEAQKKEKIGGLLNPNIEKMVRLKPTHLFGMPSHEKLNQQLESLGYKITMMSNEKISDVLESIKIIGSEINRQESARLLIENINKSFSALKVQDDNQEKVPAALLIGRTKGSLQNMMVAGKDTYMNEIWEMVGGKNIYEDLPTRYGAINLESLLIRNPAVIIEFDMQKERSIQRVELGAEWQLLKNNQVIKNRQVYVVGGNHTMIPGPRMTQLAEDFENIIERVRKNPISN